MALIRFRSISWQDYSLLIDNRVEHLNVLVRVTLSMEISIKRVYEIRMTDSLRISIWSLFDQSNHVVDIECQHSIDMSDGQGFHYTPGSSHPIFPPTHIFPSDSSTKSFPSADNTHYRTANRWLVQVFTHTSKPNRSCMCMYHMGVAWESG